MLAAEREEFRFDITSDHGVGWLERAYGVNGDESLQLGDGVVRDANFADFSLGLELDESLPAFLDFFIGFGPVELVEVDGVGAESSEAGFTFGDDAAAAKAFADLTISQRDSATLGGDERSGGWREQLQGFTDEDFALTFSVNRGGIDPVDSQFDGAEDGGDGGRAILISPAEFPVTAADGPCAKSDDAECRSGGTKPSLEHNSGFRGG